MAVATNGPFPPLTCPRSRSRKPVRNRSPGTLASEKGRRWCRIFTSVSPESERPASSLFAASSQGVDLVRDEEEASVSRGNRREFLLKPLLAIGGAWLASRSAAEAATTAPAEVSSSSPSAVSAAPPVREDVIVSRIYDATVIGEPLALGKDKNRVWDKLLDARVVYLGEAEHVPVSDDKDLELEIVKNLRNKCFEQQRSISLALEAFPCNLQEQLNYYMSKRIDGESLKSHVSHWPSGRWSEYEPLLSYCRNNGVRLMACGTPLEVLRTVQAEGIRGLSAADRKIYTPPAGGGFVSGFAHRTSVDVNSSNSSIPFGPSSYLSAQSRVVEEYTMSQIVLQALHDGGSVGMLVVVAGASHVVHGSRGVGLPARISKKLPKKNQVVILLNPERQDIRKEGEVPTADFLWYSAARPCSRNCFDRAEIARVMNAASRRRDALPQDLQRGLDLGVVSPEVLQNFFDLEQYPFISELTKQFQGFRERLLADPKFLHRLAIEEAISVTTTLLAQYERRKEHFLEEIDYVLTDTVRGSVVDFFTVWLPAPTLSFLSYEEGRVGSKNIELLKGFLGSIPDNAFQTNIPGKDWNLSHRIASVLVGGMKLFGVGFVSSIAAVASSNTLYAVRKNLNPALVERVRQKRSPILKTALIYGSFLGSSANVRYQIIAGLIEHRLSNEFLSSAPFLVNVLSFVARTVNSYWGTQQWVDLARFTGLQTRTSEAPSSLPPGIPMQSTIDGEVTMAGTVDSSNNQPSDGSAL